MHKWVALTPVGDNIYLPYIYIYVYSNAEDLIPMDLER